MTLEEHAFLAPSAAHRWVRCPGSALMESKFPELGDDAAAREGTATHWVMWMDFVEDIKVEANTVTEGGVTVDATMLQAVDMLRRDIERRLGPNWRSMVIVERLVAVPRVHGQCWGTPDVRAWIQLPDGRRKLLIWDLKYGFKRVEAFENEQTICYALGCLSEANDTPRMFGSDVAFSETLIDIELVIVQPRAYHESGPVRAWSTTATGLREYAHRLSMAADEATGPTPVCKPQPDACENCRARSGCDALQVAVYRGMDIARQATPRELSNEAAGLELAMLADVKELIDARISGLEEVVKHRIGQAQRVPHWAYGRGQGRTKWTKSPREVIVMASMLGVDIKKPDEPLTPIQTIAAGVPETLVRKYSETVPGAVKLVRDDGSTTRRIFGAAT